MAQRIRRRMMAPVWCVMLAASGAACKSDEAGPAAGEEGARDEPAAAEPGATSGTAEPGTEAPKVASSAGASGEEVPASELEYVEMKVDVDTATGNAKEDNFRYFRVWGELKNNSSHWIERIAGDIRYFDANGKELKADSITTAVKEDVGDTSPGEPIGSEVMYIAPGASVPLHHIRALSKLGGRYGSYKITLQPARVVSEHPDVVLEEMKDEVVKIADRSLPDVPPDERRVVSGTLRNKGTLGCRDPGLVVGFYDAEGKLADLKEADAKDGVSDVLAAGATVPLKFSTPVGFDEAWKAKAKIRTWVRCSKPYH